MQVSICATAAGDKDIVAARLCCIYTRRERPISLLTLSVTWLSSIYCYSAKKVQEHAKVVWHKLHKHIETIISGLRSQKRAATIYFRPSVGDHGGAKVASGLVCWS
jgi:hypothetical protein